MLKKIAAAAVIASATVVATAVPASAAWQPRIVRTDATSIRVAAELTAQTCAPGYANDTITTVYARAFCNRKRVVPAGYAAEGWSLEDIKYYQNVGLREGWCARWALKSPRISATCQATFHQYVADGSF